VLTHKAGKSGVIKKNVIYRPVFLYRDGLSHKWFVVFKFVSFRILQNGIRANMFNFFLCFNKVWVSPLLLLGFQL
jgi:hypothetical protein